MANNKNPNEKQPGENPEGKFHYNPGNMAGKKAKVLEDKPDSELPAKEKAAD
jgi:hypothetical protein